MDPYSGWISSLGLRSQISALTEFKSYFVTTLTLTLTSYFWSRYSLIQVLRIIIKCGTQWPHIQVYEENRLEARHLYLWAQALETHSQCPWGSLVSLADASNVLRWRKESGHASRNLSTNYKIWPFIKFLLHVFCWHKKETGNGESWSPYTLHLRIENYLTKADISDVGSIPGLGRFPEEGNGYPLQCSCLETSMDRGAWQAAVSGVTKSPTRLKWLST